MNSFAPLPRNPCPSYTLASDAMPDVLGLDRQATLKNE
jgi:hypothetical protein